MKKASSFLLLFMLLALTTLISKPGYSQETDSSEYYFQKGIEEKTFRHFLVAAFFFDKAIQFNSKHKEAYLENGYVNLEMRKTDNAMLQFSKVLELDPQNTAAIKELMELNYNYHRYAKAREMADRCTGCLNAEKIKAMCSYNEEDYGTAAKEFINYLAKKPDDADATYALARSYFENGDFKNAIPYYNKAILLNTEKNTWTYELALLYYNTQDFKNAVLFLKKAAEQGYPQGKDFKETLGYAYMFSGDATEGEKILYALKANQSDNTELMRDFAMAFYDQRMYQRSLDYCQQLMQLNNKDAKALYLAGRCYQKSGQKEKGDKMCDKAIEMDPSLGNLRQKLSDF